MNLQALLAFVILLLNCLPNLNAETELKQHSIEETNRINVQRLQDLYDLLEFVEDDIDRLTTLSRSSDEIEAIRDILEARKTSVLNELSGFKGFEYLTTNSHRRRFAGKADHLVFEITTYITAGVIVSGLLLSTINIKQGSLNIPCQACVHDNISAIKDFIQKAKSLVLPDK